jgi:ADP-heptose:LPS heptosyltransferase
MPAERWAGSHLNPEHLTNWNYDRFEHLVSMRFERYQIVKQQLSFIGTATFERSDIFDRPARSDVDETFVAILEKPRIRRNKRRIVIRRDDALGDTLLATPLVQSVKAQFPDSDVAFVTRHTQVFQGNPFVDLVATPRFEPAEDDQIINLNGAYERSREMHAVEAYFDVAQICPSTFKPTLFPAQVDYRHVAGILLEQWRDSRIAKIVTIHAQASSPDRIWPAEHWKSFLESIAVDESVGVVLVGAGHDFGATELGLQPDARLISFVNSADLMVTAAAIALSDVFVAPDSGLSHVAAAVNTPSVVLFGMAVPATRLSLDGSATSVWSPVECRGCLDDLPPEAAPLCRFGVAHCMEHIDANDVLEPARALLSRASPNAWRRKVKSLGLAVDIPRPTRAAASSRMERRHVLTHLFTKLTRTQH